MKALNAMALDNSIKIVKIVNENLAGKIAPLYIKYYKRTTLDEVTFMHRWQLTNAHKNYHMLAAFHSHSEEPTGFLDFSLVPSIFWQPYLARIDSVYVDDLTREAEISDALFQGALEIMKHHCVSKIIAVTCTNYEQEIRLLSDNLELDNNPVKRQFALQINN